jgi:predicted HTH domain antitoxin
MFNITKRKEKALELYIKGKFSIGKVSEFAGTYIGEFYEYMKDKGIESNLTLNDFEDSLKHAERQ